MRLVVTLRNREAVATGSTGGPAAGVLPDTYRERLIKYIPAEVIVLFVAAYGATYAVLGTDPFFPRIALWIVLAGLIGTPLYLWKAGQVSDPVQLSISTIGFVVWVFALGVLPISDLPWYNQVVAALVLPVYVFVSPLAEGIPDRW